MPNTTPANRLSAQMVIVQRAQRDLVRALVAVQANDEDTLANMLAYVGLAVSSYANTARLAAEVEECVPNLFNANCRQAAQALVNELRTLGAISDDLREQRRTRRK